MKHSKHMKIKESSKVDIRKHRFVPNMSTSSKMMKSQKDKERDSERRNWKQKLRNGDYDEYDESYECPNCGYEFDDEDADANECPTCGEPIHNSDKVDYDDDSSYKFTVTDIEWDTDGEDASNLHLPETLVVDVPMEYLDNGSDAVEDYISDFLSDTYGYCHNGFSVEGLDDDYEDEEGQEFDESTPDGYEYKVSCIQWDVDDEADLDELPDTLIVTVPEEVCAVDEEEDWISDYLSDTYGFCHSGFVFDPVGEFDESIMDGVKEIGRSIKQGAKNAVDKTKKAVKKE